VGQTILLSKYLPAEHITIPLKARTFRAALSEMVAKLVAEGAVRDAAEIDEELASANARDVVTIADVALPHFRTEAVDRLLVSLGVAPEPLDVGDSGIEVAPRIVVLIIAPPEAATLYLQTVAALARFFESRDAVRALTEAQSPGDVLTMPEVGGLKIRPQLSVHDLMTHNATTVAPEMRARDAVDVMVRKRLRALPVVGEKGEVLGIITEWDVMRGLLPHIPSVTENASEEDSDGEPLTVREVMTRSVLCVSEEMGLEEAVNLMINKKVEQCPVVKESVFTGMLTRTDIIRKLFAP
jgi:CBS domain-containing protein/mannitol/fructose-specific phosphotransferase system IIA component (Ntr-type)